MADGFDQLTTDVAKGVWYLKNSVHLLPATVAFTEHEINVATDKLIAENQDRKLRGEPPVHRVKEIDEYHEYQRELCEELRGAIKVGLELKLPMPACHKLIQSLESINREITPDCKTFVFDALVELESLMLMAEADPKRVAMFCFEDSGKADLESISKDLCESVLAAYYQEDPEREFRTADSIAPELNERLLKQGKRTSASTFKKCDRYQEACSKTSRDRQKPEITKMGRKRVSFSGAVQDSMVSPAESVQARLIAEQEREMAAEEGRRGRSGRLIRSRD